MSEESDTAVAVQRRRPTRSIRVAGIGLLLALLAALSFVGVSTASNDEAEAWAWSPQVTLNGRVGCTYSANNTVQWAWVSASNGEAGWARLGSGGMTRSYSYTFQRVPSSGMTVTVTWGCSIDGQHRSTFGVQRPAVGTGATRNLCYWSPCF